MLQVRHFYLLCFLVVVGLGALRFPMFWNHRSGRTALSAHAPGRSKIGEAPSHRGKQLQKVGGAGGSRKSCPNGPTETGHKLERQGELLTFLVGHCRLSQFGKQATVEPWLIVWYSGFSGVVGVGKGQEGEYQGGQSLDNTNERGHDKLTSGICVQNEVSFSAEH